MSGELAFVSCTVNGVAREFHVRPEEMLIDVLRERLGLTGTKLSCDLGACGACTVLVNGKPVSSCGTFAWQAGGADITTIEGAGSGGWHAGPGPAGVCREQRLSMRLLYARHDHARTCVARSRSISRSRCDPRLDRRQYLSLYGL